MNRLTVLLAAALILTLSGCEKDHYDNPYEIPEYVLSDFQTRNPGATILEDHYCPDYRGKVDLDFIDRDGIKGTTIYSNGHWTMDQKEYPKKDFIYLLPRKVARTYIGVAPEDECYDFDSHYVVEISRPGFDHKQYEFCFSEPRVDEDTKGMVYYSWVIVIDDEGSLVYLGHGGLNRSIWWYDIEDQLRIVRSKYPSADILGAVNEWGHFLVFIKDKDGIRKIVKLRNVNDWAWDETRYRMADNTVLPESALKDVDEYIADHPGAILSAIYHVEDKFGEYYGLQFGDDWNCTTIFSKID